MVDFCGVLGVFDGEAFFGVVVVEVAVVLLHTGEEGGFIGAQVEDPVVFGVY